MTVEMTYFAAFLVGLLGGVHCVGMCGGIVGALSFGLKESIQKRPLGSLPYLLMYNAGRLFSYTLAGALLGGLGLLLVDLVAMEQAKLVLQVLASLFMVVLGLYLGGWWSGLLKLERLGGRLWKLIEPLAKRLMPVQSLPQALSLGVVWGWLPCGMVYSMLVWSLASGSAVEGGLLLLSFGLGTLPNLLAMGLFAGKLATTLRKPWVRQLAGVLVILFGVLRLYQVMTHEHGDHSGHSLPGHEMSEMQHSPMSSGESHAGHGAGMVEHSLPLDPDMDMSDMNMSDMEQANDHQNMD